eukprot:GHVR01178849.1.p1 GENE.GHVR01178849.1~~GHVR01178849.1.p1  ORF type:complete len:205 (-),score=87.11 GHVR01178849.1:372-986(-)
MFQKDAMKCFAYGLDQRLRMHTPVSISLSDSYYKKCIDIAVIGTVGHVCCWCCSAVLSSYRIVLSLYTNNNNKNNKNIQSTSCENINESLSVWSYELLQNFLKSNDEMKRGGGYASLRLLQDVNNVAFKLVISKASYVLEHIMCVTLSVQPKQLILFNNNSGDENTHTHTHTHTHTQTDIQYGGGYIKGTTYETHRHTHTFKSL